ncbi:MAG: SGNH/GDSL hydrolase family protein [Micrococcales bacterium]|nr:SGNH/GDSL hydrolase family protein [Micrococcales bacterium]
MSRARRAQRIASSAAYGGGRLAAGVGAAGAVGYAVIRAEAALARRFIGTPFDDSPDDNGIYGAGPGEPLDLLVLGDSTAAGMGADTRYQTVGAIIATGVSALRGRPVRLTNLAEVGAESADLARQIDRALAAVEQPAVAVILVGGNDVTHRVERATAVGHLEAAVRRLRTRGLEVVVGTCPDLGTIEPVAQPLRWLARRWSRDLAAAQTVAVVEAGGRTVSLGDLLGEEFSASPSELFSVDRFHPSAAGYARVAAALLPTVCAALDIWGTAGSDRAPERGRGEGFGPVAVAAGKAVRDPGTEVSATQVAGQERGPRGRWAVLRHRRTPVPSSTDEAGTAATPPGQGASADGAPQPDEPVEQVVADTGGAGVVDEDA